jgi:pyruvate/2-oxoacid:ferredoxin oxidoreductase beta subunit
MTLDLPFLKPIKSYLSVQGRYRHLSEAQIAVIETNLKARYSKLQALCRITAEV